MNTLKILGILFLTILCSCGGSSGGGGGGDDTVNVDTPEGPEREEDPNDPNPSPSRANFDVTLDSELTDQEEATTKATISRLEQLDIDGDQINGFRDVFNGDSTSSVVRYLESRVNYIISQSTAYDSRYAYNGSFFNPLAQGFYAINPSLYLWYTKLNNERISGTDVNYVINGRERNINSSRIGVIQLGDVWLDFGPITQAIVLVHEARHSDCPNGAWASDLDLFNAGVFSFGNPSCGQSHNPDATDRVPWGANFLTVAYAIAINQTCSNCSTEERQEALGVANSFVGRIYDLQGTLDDNYGPPNMGNSSRIREDL